MFPDCQYDPALHGKHLVEPRVEIEPSPHQLHDKDPAAEKKLGGQATQALFTSKVPAGQGVQEDEFREEVKPGGHKVQTPEPSGEKVPGMQV